MTKQKSPELTVGMICKNAEETIGAALESVKWAKQIIIIDENSTDKTVDIALKYTDNIISTSQTRFDRKRNRILKQLKTRCVFYVDADEVVSKALKDEIKVFLGRFLHFFWKKEDQFVGRKEIVIKNPCKYG